ncbi:hypothetical protein WS79_07755 [Burkholderia territorii]|nr:hypothetical protein WS79_07755 [Burkholderia territorii]
MAACAAGEKLHVGSSLPRAEQHASRSPTDFALAAFHSYRLLSLSIGIRCVSGHGLASALLPFGEGTCADAPAHRPDCIRS